MVQSTKCLTAQGLGLIRKHATKGFYKNLDGTEEGQGTRPKDQ